MARRWASLGALGWAAWLAFAACGDEATEAGNDAATTGATLGADSVTGADSGSDSDSDSDSGSTSDSGSGTGSDPDAAADVAAETTVADVMLGDPDVLAGTFIIQLIAPVTATQSATASPGATAFFGKVYDGATPSTLAYSEAAGDADCRLMVPRVPFCEAACGGSAACVEDDVCQAYPNAHAVGKVTVTGLQLVGGATTFTLDPVAKGYQAAGEGDEALRYPAFAEGGAIEVSTSGGDYAPFTVSAVGIAPLAVANVDAVTVAHDTPFVLDWTPPGVGAPSRVTVALDLSHHGGNKGVLLCDVPDSGHLVVAQTLIDALLDLGFAGLPTVVITRRVVGQTTIESGRVELVVQSKVEIPVTIPGLISCLDTSQCPEGQTCGDDLRCQ